MFAHSTRRLTIGKIAFWYSPCVRGVSVRTRWPAYGRADRDGEAVLARLLPVGVGGTLTRRRDAVLDVHAVGVIVGVGAVTPVPHPDESGRLKVELEGFPLRALV